MPQDWSTFGVDLHLAPDTAEGRRAGLERALRDAIRSGRLAEGTRLPATRTLARELGMARGTVSAAYDQLAAEGYLLIRHGSGTRVASIPGPGDRPARRPSPPVPRHDLRPGTPDVSSFPVAAWLRASRRALNAAAPPAFGYGDPRGRPELRAALADYLGRTRGVAATPDRIVITAGYAHALRLLAQILAPATIAMEDPGLPYHREIVTHAGCRTVPLPVDHLGARPDTLTTERAAVLTPAHQYPTGVVLHPSRRRALIDWARAAGSLLIEDDYDGEFRYDRQPVGALQGTSPERVVYVGTAAKTLAPAVRLAWMVLPGHLVETVTEALRLTALRPESLGQLALAELITTHAYDRHIRTCRLRYRRRRDLLLAAIPSTYTVQGIAAGQHVLVGLPATGPTEQELEQKAATLDLAFGTLTEHYHHPGDHPQGLIVGYGTPREAAYPPALQSLTMLLTSSKASGPRAIRQRAGVGRNCGGGASISGS
jgi:GntR family transcriptional regulator/MocR family aminotransferase